MITYLRYNFLLCLIFIITTRYMSSEFQWINNQALSQDILPVAVSHTPLNQAITACQNTFITHTLAHTTTVSSDVVRLYDSNGAGLAVND